MAPDASGPQPSDPGDGARLAPMTTQVNLSRPGSVSPINHTNPTNSHTPHYPSTSATALQLLVSGQLLQGTSVEWREIEAA